MPRTFLQRVWLGCYHKFSWPRRSDDGNYYQVCLECGVRYKYDWRSMRRTARLEEAEESPAARRPVRISSGHNAWRPRERRLRTEVAVEFREVGGHEWRSGQAQNISRSGLLFSVEEKLLPARGTDVEVALLMPAEICGEGPAEVLCQARVTRVHEAHGHQPARIAVSISDYVYLPERKLG